MAHADYECCAVCDSKGYYSNDAGSKEIICSECVASLARRGVIVGSVEELKVWMTQEEPAKVVSLLQEVGFSVCRYGNDVDDLFESRLTSRAVDEGESAPLQAESTPEHLPIEEAGTTPALRN